MQTHWNYNGIDKNHLTSAIDGFKDKFSYLRAIYHIEVVQNLTVMDLDLLWNTLYTLSFGLVFCLTTQNTTVK